MPEHSSEAPRVSVVIPAYNSEAYLGTTLKSVIAQTFSAWEMIVYDDGSTDATEAVARQFAAEDSRIKMFSAENRGVAVARNRGFAETNPRSEFVIFLDNDDVWLPDMLDSLVAVLDAHPEYAGAHTLVRCIDEFGDLVPSDDLEQRLRDRKGFHDGRLTSVEPSAPTTFADLVFENWVVSPGALLVRRPIFDRTGGFDASTVPADDWDMVVRLSRLGDFGRVDTALLLWRRHAGAQSYHSPSWRSAVLRARDKTLMDRSNTPEQLRAGSDGLHDLRARDLADGDPPRGGAALRCRLPPDGQGTRTNSSVHPRSSRDPSAVAAWPTPSIHTRHRWPQDPILVSAARPSRRAGPRGVTRSWPR